jgi:ribosome-binding factor A
MAIRDTHTRSFLISVLLFIVLVSPSVLSFLLPNPLTQVSSPIERTQQPSSSSSSASSSSSSTTYQFRIIRSRISNSVSSLYIQRGNPGRSAPRGKDDKSKRQYRVGELVKTELAHILHSGLIKGKGVSYLDDELRSRISIVKVDVSPDLRQARVSVSIRDGGGGGGGRKVSTVVGTTTTTTTTTTSPSQKDDASIVPSAAMAVTTNDAMVDKRRAYSWLVENTKAIRHTLAQRMSHLKNSPSLTFAQVDVSAAVDVMYLIDKVAKGYQRERIGEYGGDDDTLRRRLFAEDDDDDDDDEDDNEWEEEDDEFFNVSTSR